MSEVWGLMPKAQDDSQTIDQAIAAAIADHEADTSAHVDVGESLYSHKAAEVIDHLAQSIVFDKFQSGLFSSKVFTIPMVTLDPFTITSAVTTLKSGMVTLRTSTVLNNTSTFACQDNFIWPCSTSHSPYIEVTVRGGSSGSPFSSCDLFIGFGFEDEQYCGFKWSNDSLVAYSHNYDTGNTTTVSISAGHVYNSKRYGIRFYVGEKIEFYIDGVLVATITTNLPTDSEFDILSVYLKNNTAGQTAYCDFGNCVFITDYLD